MSMFTGAQGKGAMKARREQKRRQAEERNAVAEPRRFICGHVSSSPDHPCAVRP